MSDLDFWTLDFFIKGIQIKDTFLLEFMHWIYSLDFILESILELYMDLNLRKYFSGIFF